MKTNKLLIMDNLQQWSEPAEINALDGRKFMYLLSYKQHIIKITRIVLIKSNHTCKVLFTT